MHRRVLPHLVLVLALAGCVGTPAAPDGPPTTDPGAPPPGAAVDLPNDASGCRLGVTVFLVEPADAARHLPDGFTPADAQSLLGTPAPTGKAAVVLGAYACRDNALTGGGVAAGEVNIAVLPPSVPGDRPAATSHYYQPAVHATGGLREALVAIGWRTVEAEARTAVDLLPTGSASARVGADDADGAVYDMDLAGAVPNALSGLSRFWHVTPTGVAWADYELEAAVAVGAASCTLRAGSLAAEVVGTTSCSDAEAVGIVAPDFAWRSGIHHRPGVWPAA